MTSPRSSIQNIITAFVEAHNNHNNNITTNVVDAIIAPRAPNCTHQVIPLDHGRKPRNNEEYREFVESSLAKGLFKDLYFEVDNTIIDAEARKACLHAWISMATPLGPFRNEYAFFLWFDENAEKITKIEEFVNTAYTGQFFAKLMAMGGKEE